MRKNTSLKQIVARNNNHFHKWKELYALWPVIPFFFCQAFRNELIILIASIITISLIFYIKYYKHEWLLFLIGIIVGAVAEFAGDFLFKLQYWNSGLFGVVPVWVLVYWGIAFVVIRRVGNIIIKD